MEQRGGANALVLALETGAVGELDVFELVDTFKLAVDEWLVGERPEMFSWLQFGRRGRQEEPVDVIRHAQAQTGVPARSVQDQHDFLLRTRSHLACEGRQLRLEERDAERGGEMKERPS